MFIPTSRVSWALVICYFFIFLGSVFLLDFIDPQYYLLYGEDAQIGSYFILPMVWVIYGIIVYYAGLKFNTKKIYEKANYIVEQTGNYRSQKTNEYKLIGIPVQYVGSLFILFGVCFLSIQIIYRLFWM